MPYIDGDGNPGHYTGHVDGDGQPNGRGKMRYINGTRFDGAWHEGTKLHGKTRPPVEKKRGNSSKKHGGSGESNSGMVPLPPPPPPPPPSHLPRKKLPGDGVRPPPPRARAPGRGAREKKGDIGDGGGRRSSQREDGAALPKGNRRHEEGDNGGGDDEPTLRPPTRSLNRLQRTCDEIETLLKDYSNATPPSDSRVAI